MKRKQPIEHIALAQRCVWVCIHTDIISSAIVWNTIAPTNCLHRSLSCCGMVTRLCNMRACASICMCPSRLETRTKESSACASSVTANASCEMNAIADYVCSAATSYIMLVCAIAGALRPERLWTMPVKCEVWRNSDGCPSWYWRANRSSYIGVGGERLIELSSSWFPSKFPSG